MSPWYLEDDQLHNAIKYVSSNSFVKKNTIKRKEKKITALIS